ncbi:MAG: PQQ-binding-like beta-propeller repeat protein, partial [Bacteroides sp.]|nr:PQQ-binding-like beta-propeller repeat protein [Bacteroides sp.]
SGRNGPILAIRPGGEGDVTDTHLLWKNITGGPHVPSAVYYQKRLYVINDTGTLSCINALSGQLIWKVRLKGRFSMSPVLSGNKIIITNEKGLTSIFKAGNSFELIAENDLKEETLASPAVLGGQIFIRTATHLYCIEKD